MKITEIEIKNVKSFRVNTGPIKFKENLNLIVGPNGSGKSNILDVLTITLRHFFLKSYQSGYQGDEALDIRVVSLKQSPFHPLERFLEKFNDNDLDDSVIKLKFIIGKIDVDNIKEIKKHEEEFQKIYKNLFIKPENITSLGFIKKWNIKKIKEGQIVSYEIINYNLTAPSEGTPEFLFLSYLNTLDLFQQFTLELSEVSLKPIYIFFSPYRSSDIQMTLQVNPTESLTNLLDAYMNSTSRSVTSLTKIAALYFVYKLRNYQAKAKKEGWQKKWFRDKEYKSVAKYLKKINYGWDLDYRPEKKGFYEFIIKKGNKKFFIGQSSSGEKEIFNFIFGILAFVKEEGLFLVDEPELHLHPAWQKLLIELFIDLSDETKCQFIASTHSPVFINDRTLSDVIRFYKNKDNSTSFVKVDDSVADKSRNVLHIVNSQNNEKMFFADKVILVEGKTDRLIFTKILEIVLKKNNRNQVIEVLEVNTREYLEKYREFLSKFGIDNYIIADLDYVEKNGGAEIKNLFKADFKEIAHDVLKNKGSDDGQSIAEELEAAISSKDIKKLKNIWERIKSRKIQLKAKLNKQETDRLDIYIRELAVNKKIFVLQRGTIEVYLPYQGKNLDNTIKFTKDNAGFLKWLKTEKGEDLKKAITTIVTD